MRKVSEDRVMNDFGDAKVLVLGRLFVVPDAVADEISRLRERLEDSTKEIQQRNQRIGAMLLALDHIAGMTEDSYSLENAVETAKFVTGVSGSQPYCDHCGKYQAECPECKTFKSDTVEDDIFAFETLEDALERAKRNPNG